MKVTKEELLMKANAAAYAAAYASWLLKIRRRC